MHDCTIQTNNRLLLNKTILKVISELRSNESERNWTRESTESILKVNSKSSREAFSNKHFASSNFLLLPKVTK